MPPQQPRPPGRTGARSLANPTGGGGDNNDNINGGANDINNNTTGGAGGGGKPSSSSSLTPAPVATSKKKQHQHQLMVQLRNAIYETHQAPPDGATAEMVLERRAQLDQLLGTLEKQFQQSKVEALDAYNNRWLKAMGGQVSRERATMDKIDRNTTEAERQVAMCNRERDATIKSKNDARTEKTLAAARFLVERSKHRRALLKQATDKQSQQYEQIMKKREDDAMAHLQRQLEAERHCEEMLHRKMDRDERERQQKEDNAEQRRRAAEDRLEELRMAKEREAEARTSHAHDALRKAHVRKIAVVLRPVPTLTVVEVPYEERVRAQEAAEREREATVRRIKHELDEHRKSTVVARHERNREFQTAKRDQMLDEHARRCTQMQEHIAASNAEAARRKAELDEELLHRSIMKDRAISQHRERHVHAVHGHQDDAKRRVFDRWNRQLRAVSHELGVAVPVSMREESMTPTPPRGGGGGGGGRASAMPQAAGATAPMPLPTLAQQQQQGMLGGVAAARGGGNAARNNHSDADMTFITQQGRSSATPQPTAAGGAAPAKLGAFVARR